jgi:hypothetical protein
MNTHPSRKPIKDRTYDSWVHKAVAPLPCKHPNVKKAIELLQEIEDFDGETMEYIISEMFMREQMLKQLIGTCDWGHIVMYTDKRRELSY